jgi:hypothetical protein
MIFDLASFPQERMQCLDVIVLGAEMGSESIYREYDFGILERIVSDIVRSLIYKISSIQLSP